jgi:hypothetical protein
MKDRPKIEVKHENECRSYVSAQLSGRWFSSKAVERLTGANTRSIRRWLIDWVKAGFLDTRVINARHRLYRVHGSMGDDLPLPGESTPAPLAPISEHAADATARARELMPEVIEILKSIAAGSPNPRAQLRAEKTLLEIGHGPAPDARLIDGDDEGVNQIEDQH